MPAPKAILLVLDGYDIKTSDKFNAVAQAKTPFLHGLLQNNMERNSLLKASGSFVGLPPGQMGNSEVGHLHIGGGRSILQGLSLINQEIKTQQIFKNFWLIDAIKKKQKSQNSYFRIALSGRGTFA